MENWRILEIDPTKDISTIKKAYAKKLKIYHPETHPKEYQKLRNAYEVSLAEAKQPQIPGDFGSDNFLASQQDDWTVRHLDTNLPHQIHNFMRDVESLYTDFFSRIREENWINLLNSELVWDVNQKANLQFSLLSFLEHHHHLPHAVWQMLDNIFDWKSQIHQLSEQFSQEFAEYLSHQINGSKEMKYEFFKVMDNFDYDAYLELRQKIQDTLMEGNLEDAEGYFGQALGLYDEDPDLLRMYGVFHLQKGDEIRANTAFTKALIHNPKDFDSFIFRAQIQYRDGQYDTVIQDCEKLLLSEPKNAEALSLIGKCHFHIGNLKKARKYFDIVREVDDFPLETETYSAQTYYPALGGMISDDLPSSTLRHNLNYATWLTIMFIARNWIYLLIFLVLEVFTTLPFIMTAVLFVPVTWEIYKLSKVESPMVKTSYLRSKSILQNTNNDIDLYLRCLSSICVRSYVGYSAFYTHHEFAPIRDRWLRILALKKDLKKWDIHNAHEWRNRIEWLLNEGHQEEFNSIRIRLSVLSYKARSAYIESYKEHSYYHKMFFLNLVIYKIRPSGITAYDIAWSIYLCRLGKSLGYIDKVEAFNIMIKAAQKAQLSYADWNEYLSAYFLGRHFAEGETQLQFEEREFYYIHYMFNSLYTPLKRVKWE